MTGDRVEYSGSISSHCIAIALLLVITHCSIKILLGYDDFRSFGTILVPKHGSFLSQVAVGNRLEASVLILHSFYVSDYFVLWMIGLFHNFIKIILVVGPPFPTGSSKE